MTKANSIVNVSAYYRKLLHTHTQLLTYEERKELRLLLAKFYSANTETSLQFGHTLYDKLCIADTLLNEIGLGKAAVLSVLLQDVVESKAIETEKIEALFQTNVSGIILGLTRVRELYEKNTSIETENFRKLFLTFAEDIRVILIIIAEHLQIMRTLDNYDSENRVNVARESSFLYAPLAHRMGLYAIKTELEDLSLKHTNREIFKEIAHKLNETKRSRDKYIHEFITPLKEKLDELGYLFDIKGRTKSIHSIYNKIKKQNTPFENIYDLFAIRIIFDVPYEKEKAACWQAYSIVADMYQPNPKRLRDWLS